MNLKSLSFMLIASCFLLSSCGDREKRNKRAEEKARAKTEKQASRVKGVGEGLKGVGADAVETVGESIGELFKGAKHGLDKSLVQLGIEVAEDLLPFVTVSRCEVHQNDSIKKAILVYAVFEQDFDGKLLLKATDKNNQEIGRSIVVVTETADNSKFIEFPFDERTTLTLIKQLKLEKR